MTADEGSEELLAAPPLLEQLFSEGGITRRLSQQSCRQGRLQRTRPSLASSWVIFMSSKKI